MSSVLSTRRRAEDFARLVEGDRTTHDPKVVPLLALVGRLRRPARIEPAPEFRAQLRERLVAAAAELPVDDVASRPVTPIPHAERRFERPAPPRTRLLAIATTTVTLIAGVVGVAMFARQALPGDTLYAVKRGLEQSQQLMSTTTASRGRQVLASGRTRLAEMTTLVEKAPANADVTRPARIALVQTALLDFAAQSREGGKLLLAAYRSEQEKASLVELRQFAAESGEQLTALAPMLPAELQPSFTEATRTLISLDKQALGLCPTCLLQPGGSGTAGSPTPSPSDQPGTVRSTGSPTVSEPRTDPTHPPTAPGPRGTADPTQRPGPLPTIDLTDPLPLPTHLQLPTSLPLPELALDGSLPPPPLLGRSIGLQGFGIPDGTHTPGPAATPGRSAPPTDKPTADATSSPSPAPSSTDRDTPRPRPSLSPSPEPSDEEWRLPLPLPLPLTDSDLGL